VTVDAMLRMSRLRITFGDDEVVCGVDLAVPRGSRVGIIGESGSGKSVTAMSVLRLNDERKMRYGNDSSIEFDGVEILTASQATLSGIRGRRISMVFQDPMTTLNPVFTVGRQIGDVLGAHRPDASRAERRDRVVASLDAVGIRNATTVHDDYPHQLSGGMRQRVMIAMATAAAPELLIADEPTSALDVTVQAAVLDTLGALVDERGMSVLMITHDMGVVARFCDEVYVMYKGEGVESGPAARVLRNPEHDYTRRLLEAVPRVRSAQSH